MIKTKANCHYPRAKLATISLVKPLQLVAADQNYITSHVIYYLNNKFNALCKDYFLLKFNYFLFNFFPNPLSISCNKISIGVASNSNYTCQMPAVLTKKSLKIEKSTECFGAMARIHLWKSRN